MPAVSSREAVQRPEPGFEPCHMSTLRTHWLGRSAFKAVMRGESMSRRSRGAVLALSVIRCGRGRHATNISSSCSRSTRAGCLHGMGGIAPELLHVTRSWSGLFPILDRLISRWPLVRMVDAGIRDSPRHRARRPSPRPARGVARDDGSGCYPSLQPSGGYPRLPTNDVWTSVLSLNGARETKRS